jgi:hypothetical protein
LDRFSSPYTINQRGYQRVYVWLQKFFEDPEQNWNDDAWDAHHCPRLELLNATAMLLRWGSVRTSQQLLFSCFTNREKSMEIA